MSQYDDGQIRHWPCVRNSQKKKKINKKLKENKKKKMLVYVRNYFGFVFFLGGGMKSLKIEKFAIMDLSKIRPDRLQLWKVFKDR